VDQVTAPPHDAIVIALDGGGSKTDGVALDLDGNVISWMRKPGSSIGSGDIQHSVSIVDSLIAELRAATGNRPLLQTNIYLSGLDLPIEETAFSNALQHKEWAVGVTGNQVIVGNDMFALLRAGSEEPNAVAVVCGTGINCVGVREDGVHFRFMAWGTISGDFGGGWFLGEQALFHAARAIDGRGPSTLLATSIPTFLGLPDVPSVVEAFHFGRLASARFHTLAPLVLEASAAGDAVANDIVDRQAEEIVTMAVTALERLELLGQAVPVVLGGGIIASGNSRLLHGIENGLAARAPMAKIKFVRSRPILGAALLALETVGAARAALDVARAALENVDWVSRV
jgi:N-acetylglucosamine kinase-like BadF-type ATPase